jgi:hypothetical protein
MAIQLKETLEKLMNSKHKREFGPWKIKIPPNKRSLLNCLNLWFLMIRIFDKLKTLFRMIPFKNISFIRRQKKLKNKEKKSKKLKKKKSKKKKSATLKIEDDKLEKEIKKEKTFSQPSKPKEKNLDQLSFNWKNFSENFYYPSIFIQNSDFIGNTLEPIIFNNDLCSELINLAQKYLNEKTRDKFNRKLLKYFLRLMISFPRSYKRDLKILNYLSDLMSFNKASIKKGNSTIHPKQ